MNTHQDRQDRQNRRQEAQGIVALTLRMPTALAAQLRRLAWAHDRSLNGEIVSALRVYVARAESEGSGDDGDAQGNHESARHTGCA